MVPTCWRILGLVTKKSSETNVLKTRFPLVNVSNSLSLRLFKKRHSSTIFFCEICKVFKSAYFVEHIRTAASNIDLCDYDCFIIFIIH